MSTLRTQQGDVDLFQTLDDGDIFVQSGFVAMSGGLETTVYLALFGGNEDDQGRKNDPFQWWGNLLETDPDRTHRSETQHLIDGLEFSPKKLLKVEEAVIRDLQFLLNTKMASEVLASVTVPEYNTLNIKINVTAQGEENEFNFVINWKNPPLDRN